MSVESKILELGLELPAPAEPVGSYVPAVVSGNLVFTSGQIPMFNGSLLAEGKVPTEVSLEAARLVTRQALMNALAAIKQQIGSLEKITKIVRLNVFVNSSETFTEQSKLANAASDTLVAIFSKAGIHTRCAVGVAQLPLNSPVELDLIVEFGPEKQQA